MNELLIPLLIVTFSHVCLAMVTTRLQERNHKLRNQNIAIRRRITVLEEDLKFFTEKLSR